VVNMLGIELDSVDAIAVSGGPGSFTGLRIGSATAKGLGFAMKKPLVQVPTVDAMAYNLFGSDLLICPIMDARRNQVYTGLYRCKEDLEVVKAQCAMDMGELVRELDERGETVVFLGDGVPVYRPLIGEMMKTPHLFAPAHMNRQRAGAVAALGAKYLAEGNVVTAEEFKPDYLRKSQAEREAAEKELEAAEREWEEAERKREEERRR